VCLPGRPVMEKRNGTINDALAYVDSVHSAQKSEGIWLADHPFV
jgi:hypothetical protein